MAITSDIETRQTNTAVVTVRIPNGADGDLATEAERRIARVEAVSGVTVEEMRGLEPGLSATEVTLEVTVTSGGDGGNTAVTELFADGVGVAVAEDSPP